MQILTLVGRITQELQLRYTKDDKAVLEIPVAINNAKNDTTFINLTAFGSTAENAAKYCSKGSIVGAIATIKNRDYEDQQGNKRHSYNFLVKRLTFLDSKGKSSPGNDNEAAPTEDKRTDAEVLKDVLENDPYADFGEQIEITDEDLPF